MSCGAKFNNQQRKLNGYTVSQEQKDKTAKSLREYAQSHPNCNHPPKPKICSACGLSHLRSGKTCSDKCASILFSNAGTNGGKRSAQVRNKRSTDEIKLFDLISTKFTAIPNHIIKDGWDADIFIPSLNAAIFWNGPWHYKEMGISGHSLKQVQNRDKIKTSLFESIGIKVYAFEDRYFTPQTAYEALLAQLN